MGTECVCEGRTALQLLGVAHRLLVDGGPVQLGRGGRPAPLRGAVGHELPELRLRGGGQWLRGGEDGWEREGETAPILTQKLTPS